MIRLFIVWRLRAVREALAQALERKGEVQVVGTASEPSALEARGRDLKPHVVVLDAPGPETIPTLRRILTVASDVKLVVLGAPESERQVIVLAETGVTGFVPPEASLGELLDTIESVVRGAVPASPEVTAILLKQVRTVAAERRAGAWKVDLTPRQIAIVELIEQGLTNKEIAQRLSIDVQTVKNHVHNVLKKLDLHRRAEAAAWARAHGLGREKES